MTTSYVSCSCNCQPRAVDWGKNGLVVYGYSNSLAIYNPDVEGTGKVVGTLHKHSSQVKVAQWIATEENIAETEILSGSLDGTVIVWSKKGDSFSPDVNLSLGDNLTTTHAVYLNEKHHKNDEKRPLLICASSFKEVFSIWQRDTSGKIGEKQILDLKRRIPTEAVLAFLPGPSRTPIVILGLDDSSIQIFAWEIQKNDVKPNFNHVKTLFGHEDWIQCLEFMRSTPTECLFASGSQDSTIRVWKIATADEKPVTQRINQFQIGDGEFEVSLETILSGHEHWVYGLHWHPPIFVDDKWIRPSVLLSCALDNTMIIWEPTFLGVWTERVRMGKVGGNALGYYGCRFNSDGSSVLAHGYQGTFHMWKHDQVSKKWLPRSAPSGHSSHVNDLHWDPKGRYLISTSSDQTTRVHIPWKYVEEKKLEIWQEIARPQIHGYDINCLAILSPTIFASGAEEKVVRIFEAPENFSTCLEEENWINSRKMVDRAFVPALGLTNKAVGKIKAGEELEGNFEDDDLDCERPPTEEEIIRHTLWPELEKLYGHGYEIFSMTARHDGKILATACKSTNTEHSSIILWSSKTWAQTQKLQAHRLTVTQMEFSPDDKFLVSASRDRRWALYRSETSSDCENISYELISMSPSIEPLHARIIWCCAWSHDSKFFATGSRDGKIGVWSVEEIQKTQNSKATTFLDLKEESVTALAFSPGLFPPNTYVLAVGVEEGTINIQKLIFQDDKSTWTTCLEFDTSTGHHKTVKRLAFRPVSRPETLQLASCSSDRAVKIHDIEFKQIFNSVN